MSSSGKPAARKRSVRYCAIAGTWPRPSEVRNEMTFWKISRASLRTSSGGAVSLAGAPAAQSRVAQARAALIVFMGGKPIGLPRTRQGGSDEGHEGHESDVDSVTFVTFVTLVTPVTFLPRTDDGV